MMQADASNEENNEDKKEDFIEENKELLNSGFSMTEITDRLTQLQDTVNLVCIKWQI